MTTSTTREPGQPICGAIFPSPDVDCVCLEAPHDVEVPHECAAVGCGQQWFDKPLRRTA